MEPGYGRHKGHFFTLLVFLGVVSAASGFVGVSLKYPISEAGLPKPEHVVDLLQILQIQRVKLEGETHPSLLRALAGSGIQVLVTVPNAQDIRSISESLECASRWLISNVVQHLPGTSIAGIIVGDGFSDSSLKAIKNLHVSLERFNLDGLKISAAVSMDVLETGDNSWPSSASFVAELGENAAQVLEFLCSTGSYLTLDVDPVEDDNFASSPTKQDGFFVDGGSQLTYTNPLDASLDSVYVSMEKLGFPEVPVVVGGSSLSENARILGTEGSPRRPNIPISAYIEATDDWLPDAVSGRRFLADGTNGSSTPPPSGFTPVPGTGTAQFCVAKQGATDSDLSVGLNWACGQGNVDCSPIMQNGPCFSPDTYFWHASYAFNAYYQKNVAAGGTCSFNGAAELTNVDPSTGTCSFTGSSGGGGIVGGGGTSNGGGNGSTVGSTNGVITPTNPNSPNGAAAGTFLRGEVLAFLLASFLVWRL